MTVRELIKVLQEEVNLDPSVAELPVYAADDCTSACDTFARGVYVRPEESYFPRRVVVGE